jgi:hypothetical protein
MFTTGLTICPYNPIVATTTTCIIGPVPRTLAFLAGIAIARARAPALTTAIATMTRMRTLASRPITFFAPPPPLFSLRSLRQQQRRCPLQQASQRRRDLDRRHLVLSLKLLDDRSKRSRLSGSQCVGDTLLEPCNSLHVD